MSGLDVESPGEDAEAVEEHPIAFGELRVRPLDRRPQAAVPRRTTEPGAGEGVEVAEPGEDLRRRHHTGAGGRHLERQRQPVERPAQLAHGRQLISAQLDPGVAGALEEQSYRRHLRIDAGRARHRQRSQHDERLARDGERRATRRQHRRRRAGLDQLGDRVRGAVEDVLAVVDDDQRRLVRRRVEERSERGKPELVGDRPPDRFGRASPGSGR